MKCECAACWDLREMQALHARIALLEEDNARLRAQLHASERLVEVLRRIHLDRLLGVRPRTPDVVHALAAFHSLTFTADTASIP